MITMMTILMMTTTLMLNNQTHQTMRLVMRSFQEILFSIYYSLRNRAEQAIIFSR